MPSRSTRFSWPLLISAENCSMAWACWPASRLVGATRLKLTSTLPSQVLRSWMLEVSVFRSSASCFCRFSSKAAFLGRTVLL